MSLPRQELLPAGDRGYSRALATVVCLLLPHGLAGNAHADTPCSHIPSCESCDPDDPWKTIWVADRGEGFHGSAQTLSIEAGAAYGPAVLGSQEQHHLALLSLAYGHMVSPVLGRNHWWRGNFEVRLELFGGLQVSPRPDWLVGFTPHLRYHFATGTPWVPFLDMGVGVGFTGIGPPDLGSVFEFNQQAGAGVQWFVSDDLAIIFEGRYMHISNAGISDHNYGLNACIGMAGVTLFF
jgi:hypothetical protein